MEFVALLVPMLLLFVIALTKSIPKIGGDVRIALLTAAVASALFAQLGPVEIVTAMIDGIDQLAWVIMLSLVGSIYAEAQVRIGAMETTLSSFRSIFGNSSKGLVISVFLTLILAGSLLGDAIAAATVIGLLVIPTLSQLKMKPEHIGMIILLGASLGSIMPPISQAVFLSASLVGIEPTNVLNVAYITVGIGSIFAIVESFRFVKGKKLPEHLQTTETLGSIIVKRWYTMIPLLILTIIIILNTGFSYSIFEWPFIAPIITWLEEIPIIQGLAFPVVLAIIVALIVSFVFPAVRTNSGDVVKTGLSKVSKTVQIQLCAGIMVGVFYASGTIDTVAMYAVTLESSALKIGGALGIILIGMITGSQTTAQTVMVTFIAPALESLGVHSTNIALGASHIAAAGQNFPPVGLTAFVVCGIVGGAMNTKVDPIKVMILALPNSLYFILIGLIAWFI